MKVVALVGLSLFLVTSAHALVKLASPFTDHMVLQRDRKVPVWGTAEPGEKIFVQFAGQKISTVAGADGKWRVELQPMKASSESRVFTVGGSKTGPLEF